jgi:DNA polymerase-3 subunit alpha
VKERHGITIDYLKLPLDDKLTMDAFSRGDTTGVFQLESSDMKGLLRSLSKTSSVTFEDIVAVVALYRPGPMDSGLMEQYVRIRQGIDVPSYDHPAIMSALSETHGVLVYQEQVMQVARDLAGFTMAEADTLRKAIGKKDLSMMTKMKDAFVDGACAGFVEVTLSDGTVGKVHAMAKFAVKESLDKFTVEEIASFGYTPINLQLIA